MNVYRDCRTVSRVFNGVFNQVGENLADLMAICATLKMQTALKLKLFAASVGLRLKNYTSSKVLIKNS